MLKNRWVTRGVLAAFTAVIAIVGTARGQGVTTITDTRSCARCSIELVRIARLGGAADSLYFSVGGLSLARDSRGRIYLGPREPRGEVPITIFDSAGRYVGTVSRVGAGPGELQRMQSFLIGPGDTLIAFDSRKAVVFSPEHRLVREYPFITPHHVGLLPARLPNGEVVIPAALSTRERAGYPLHRISPEGEILNSFGEQLPVVRPDRTWDIQRYVTPAGGNRIWSINVNRYQMELWDVSGRLLRVVERETPIFPPWTETHPDEGFWQPRVFGITQDPAGLIWTLLALPRPNANLPGNLGSQEWTNARYDTVIEVMDPQSGQLLATHRVSQRQLRGFWDGNLLTSYDSDQDGTPYIDIWQVRLVRPTMEES